jgi:hypothetical protein
MNFWLKMANIMRNGDNTEIQQEKRGKGEAGRRNQQNLNCKILN